MGGADRRGMRCAGRLLSAPMLGQSVRAFGPERMAKSGAGNHTQFSGIKPGARFDVQGNQVNNLLGEFPTA